MSPEEHAEVLKRQGNDAFSQSNYNQAISYYTRAIMKNPFEPKYFTNRALCHAKTSKWNLVSSDCQRAIELYDGCIKGHFLLGRALFQRERYRESLKHLKKALELSFEQQQTFQDEICAAVHEVKKVLFFIEEEQKKKDENELQIYLKDLVIADRDRRLANFRENMEPEVTEHATETRELSQVIEGELVQHCHNHIVRSSSSCVLCNSIAKEERQCDTQLALVTSLFQLVDEKRAHRDVPDYICDKISFGILRDPVITPYGITYERSTITEHLKKVGAFDPVTRKPLKVEDLISNLAMKEVCDIFLEKNPWAYDY